MNDILSMWQSGRRRRADPSGAQSGADACLSDLTLDRLTLDQCPPPEREAAQAHLHQCPACSEALEAIAADHRRFSQEADVPALARDALARAQTASAAGGFRARALRWLAPALGLGLAAAGLLLWTRPGGDEMRAKGGFAVELYVKHAEAAGDGRLHTGEALHPGDRVRLRLTGAASHVAVLAVDTSGRVSVYHPAGGVAATPADRGPALLPGAVELDATLGTEVILAFDCPGPIAIDRLVSAVQQATDRGRVGSDPAAAVGPVQTPCVATRYQIEKAAPAGAR